MRGQSEQRAEKMMIKRLSALTSVEQGRGERDNNRQSTIHIPTKAGQTVSRSAMLIKDAGSSDRDAQTAARRQASQGVPLPPSHCFPHLAPDLKLYGRDVSER